jgi:hypothetical protein
MAGVEVGELVGNGLADRVADPLEQPCRQQISAAEAVDQFALYQAGSTRGPQKVTRLPPPSRYFEATLRARRAATAG